MAMQEPDGQANGGAEDTVQDSRPLLSDIFWRDEILQVMYWHQGEGFGTEITARDLQTFLTTDEQSVVAHLERMVAEGYLERADLSFAAREGDSPPPSYYFTEFGAREGARRFADEFADITKQAHGDCPPDCPICKDLPPEDCVHCHSVASGEPFYGV